jgi:hypothetical protein
MQICDAVAVASLLNATLVIPIFHLNSVWRDPRYLFLFCLLSAFIPHIRYLPFMMDACLDQ